MLKTVITIKLGLDKEMNFGSKLLAMTISPGIAILANQKMVGIAKLMVMLVHLPRKVFNFHYAMYLHEKQKLTLSKIGCPHLRDVQSLLDC